MHQTSWKTESPLYDFLLFQAGLDVASFNFEMTAKKLEEDRNRMKKENEQIMNDEVEKMKVSFISINLYYLCKGGQPSRHRGYVFIDVGFSVCLCMR